VSGTVKCRSAEPIRVPTVPRDLRTSLKTEAWTSLLAAAVFASLGGLSTALVEASPWTVLGASLVPIPVGAFFALGKSSPRVAEALTHRGFRFAFTLSVTLSLVWLATGESPGVRLGAVSFLLGVAAGNWYLYSVAGVEYAGDEGSVLPP
jgi:hypothetical protein